MCACSVSSPESLFCCSAFCTACSISRCELTPTILRNLRMLRLNVSWSTLPPRKNLFGELLAELDAPLVEAVDVPDHALGEHLVLVERDQPAEMARVELVEIEQARGPVSRGLLVRG